MSRTDRTLYRDTDDKKLGGVCSGLARYFDLDPLLVRVAFVAGIFVSGASLIVYPLLWLLVDPAPAGEGSETTGDAFPAPTVADESSGDSRAA